MAREESGTSRLRMSSMRCQTSGGGSHGSRTRMLGMRESERYERDLSKSGQRAVYHHGGWKGACLAEASQVALKARNSGFSLMINRSRHCQV